MMRNERLTHPAAGGELKFLMSSRKGEKVQLTDCERARIHRLLGKSQALFPLVIRRKRNLLYLC